MLRHIDKIILFGFIFIFTGCHNHSESVVSENNTSVISWEQRDDIHLHNLNTDIVLYDHYDQESNKHFFTFSAASPAMEINDVLIFPRSVRFPYGLLRKVDNIDQNDDGSLYVVTHPACLADIFLKLHIDIVKNIEPEKIVDGWGNDIANEDPDTLHVLSKAEGVTVSLEDIDNSEEESKSVNLTDTNSLKGINVKITDLKIADKVHVNGNIHLSPTIHLNLDVGTSCKVVWDGLHSHIVCHTVIHDQTHFIGDLSLGENLGVTIESQADVKNVKVSVANLYLGEIDIQVGPVPLVFIAKLDVNLPANIQTDSAIDMGMEYHFTTTEGVTYQNGYAEPVSNISYDVKPTVLSAEGKANLKIGTSMDLGLFLYDVLGPWISLEPYMQITDNDDEVKYYWGVEGSTSFGVKFLDYTINGFTYTLFNEREEVDMNNN